MHVRPTAEEERRLELIQRVRGWKRTRMIDADQARQIQVHLTSPWKHGSLLSRIAFFFLTALAVGALFGLLNLADTGVEGWVTAAIALGLGELLIGKKRFIHTGIEEGLYLVGLFFLVFQNLSGNDKAVLLLLAGAAVFAGLRVLNAWFIVLGVACGLFYIWVEFDPLTCGTVSMITGVVALCLLGIPFRRPLYSSALAGIALLTPLLTWAALRSTNWGAFRSGSDNRLLICLAVLAIAATVASLIFRTHAALLSAILSTGLLAVELSRRVSWSPEGKLIMGGISLFIAAVLLERWLRVPRRRFTSQKLIEPDSRLLDVAAIYSAASVASPAADVPQRQEGEGGFGGAGASGDYK